MNLKNRLLNKFRVASGNTVDIDPSVRMRKCTVIIKGEGNRLFISKNTILTGVDLEIVGSNCLMEIGTNTIIGHNTYLSVKEHAKSLMIGQNCNLSRNVTIMCADGHDILAEGKRINSAKNIKIANGVWLADGAVVLKSVTIGDGAVVGIKSVVTKDVPAGCIAVGNPAKIVREGITNRWDHTW